MQGFPETVTRAQMRAACEALGLPLKPTRTVTMDVSDGVTVTAFLTDDEGHKLTHGDEPVRFRLHLPVTRDEDGEQTGSAGQQRVVLDVTGDDVGMAHLVEQQMRRR